MLAHVGAVSRSTAGFSSGAGFGEGRLRPLRAATALRDGLARPAPSDTERPVHAPSAPCIAAVILFGIPACSSSSSSVEPADSTAASDGAVDDSLDIDGSFDGASEVTALDAGDAAAHDAAPADAPSETLRFAFVGCNRLQSKDATAANPSTANVAQLQRTFDEIAALDPKPSVFFLAGDLVLGLTDAPTLKAQLEAWKPLWEASSAKAAGIRLIALPGNHEAETKDASGTEVPYDGAEATWLAAMAPYIAGSNGPTAGGADGLATDQSRLTYSFDIGATHFVVLDTDPMGTAGGTVPVKWIHADLAAARAAGAKHIFALGHKPAYPAPAAPTDGFTDATTRDAFWSALESVHAEAMLAAHNHLWFSTQPHTGSTWQIVAGNGGSKLEKGVTGADAYYGFTVVDVAATTVTLTSYGRALPVAGYAAAAPATETPTTVRAKLDLTVK